MLASVMTMTNIVGTRKYPLFLFIRKPPNRNPPRTAGSGTRFKLRLIGGNVDGKDVLNQE